MTFAGTVLVTGASSGIGRATALLLARRGCPVVLVSRSEGVLEQVRAECEAAGGRALVVVADVTDGAAVDAAFTTARRTFGPVTGVVHAAGALAFGRFEDIPAEVFDGTVATVLTGTATVARRAMTEFRTHDGGDLVVLGSLLGRISAPYMSPYVAAKHGVHGLVRALQIEARSTPGTHISLVWPGVVNTPIYAQAGGYLGRRGRPLLPVDSPEKVARTVLRTLDRPRRASRAGWTNGVSVAAFHAVPGVFDRVVTPFVHAGLEREGSEDTPGNVLEAVPEGEAVHGRLDRRWLRPLGQALVTGGRRTLRRRWHRARRR
ncbi:SDR family NAD(P)-dependent oxidoreductase [Janibacter cremeus]|uniref:SDR family NAD(P)-dependent oxidoreductase n=1 Tax=Janibacter cremeus TaxID=1285192 RepID=UPI0023F95248|nr:SDR family NAD(P)-dependent oxidoreductase [Janibacter cremeus]WEV77614.1 SDR family NAD(P)-dependent oxidoreductase [Janibacter cremeus]